jgi:SAM-dependent methyltransferase
MSSRWRSVVAEPEYDIEYTRYQTDRNRLRKLARRPWLRASANFVDGPAVDLGCGAGELLARLPAGSIGLEINRATVAHCQSNGLDVCYYDGTDDGWSLSPVRDRGEHFDSLVLSHVLEHLEDPMAVLRALLVAAGNLDMRQVLVIVPGAAGYRSDQTHRTFVDREMLGRPEVTSGTSFAVTHVSYFPGNIARLGQHFVYHELRTSFVRSRP